MSASDANNNKRARREDTLQAQRDAHAARAAEQYRLRMAVRRTHAPEAARLAAEAIALVRALMALEETMQEAEPSASFCDDGGSLEAAEHILDAVPTNETPSRATAAKPYYGFFRAFFATKEPLLFFPPPNNKGLRPSPLPRRRP